MTKWAQIFRFVILCICWDTQSEKILVFDNYQRCPVPLSMLRVFCCLRWFFLLQKIAVFSSLKNHATQATPPKQCFHLSLLTCKSRICFSFLWGNCLRPPLEMSKLCIWFPTVIASTLRDIVDNMESIWMMCWVTSVRWYAWASFMWSSIILRCCCLF